MKLLLSLALVSFVFPRADLQDCDLAKVENAYWCETCSEVKVKGDLVSKKTYYVCGSCGVTQEAAGTCADCDVALTKKTSGNDVCGECYEQPAACQVCVKEYYECPDCAASSDKAGNCAECKTALEKKVSRALVRYECADCDAKSLVAGNCTTEDCTSKGKALKKTCTESGFHPHIGK